MGKKRAKKSTQGVENTTLGLWMLETGMETNRQKFLFWFQS